MTEGGVDVMGFHLHRFLVSWMMQHEVARLFVTLGFEATECQSVTWCVEPSSSQPVAMGWTFDDLCHTYRRGDGRLHWEQGGGSEPVVLHAVPILDHPAMGGPARGTWGFGWVPEGAR